MTIRRLFNGILCAMTVALLTGSLSACSDDDPEDSTAKTELPGDNTDDDEETPGDSSEEPGDPDAPDAPGETAKPVLQASDSTIVANGTDRVTFTVRMDGEDVTASSKLFVNGQQHTDFAFTTMQAGTYQFYAVVHDSLHTDTLTVTATAPVVVDDTKPALYVSDSTIVANGTDMATFTVKMGDRDVTDESILFLDNKLYAGFTFTTEDAGTYKFYAIYNNVVTRTVTVTATADPNRYDGFRRRLLAVQSTGSWCSWCPRVTRAIMSYLETDGAADDIVFTAAHYNDGMSSTAADALNSLLVQGRGYPLLTMNLDPSVNINQDATPTTGASYIRMIARTLLRTGARTGISVKAPQPGISGVLTVSGDVKVGVSGSYKVAVWLLQDNIYEKQNDGYNSGIDALNYHNNVVKAISSYTNSGDVTGELLDGEQTTEAYTTHPYSCQFNLRSLGLADVMSDLHCIVVVTVKGANNAYTVDNVVSCNIGESKDCEYK